MTNFTAKMTKQYVQSLYQKNAESAKAAHEKTLDKKADAKGQTEGYEEEAAVYEGSVRQENKAGTYTKPVSVNANKKNDLQTKLEETYANLSEEAKAYLEELKEKFGDIDFFVADCTTDEEMNRYFAMGTKKYSCVISSDILEQMATDEEVRAKYESIIDGADEKLEEVKQEVTEELGEEAASKIESFAISIDDNGVVTYFAKLKEANDAYYEKLKETRAEEKKEEAELAEKEREKKADRAEKPSYLVQADSKEGLLAALREALGIPAEEETELVVSENAGQETAEAEIAG